MKLRRSEIQTCFGTMKTVTQAEFTAHSEEWLHSTVQNAEEVVITQNGKPLATLSPFVGKTKPHPFIGCNKGKAKILGDIVNAIPGVWETDE